MQRGNAPDRTAAAHLPPLIACTSSSSRSSHPESVWNPDRSSGRGGVAQAISRYRSPYCCPWWQQLAEIGGRGQLGREGRSREKRTRIFRAAKNGGRGNEDGIKVGSRQFDKCKNPKSDSSDEGAEGENTRRKGESAAGPGRFRFGGELRWGRHSQPQKRSSAQHSHSHST